MKLSQRGKRGTVGRSSPSLPALRSRHRHHPPGGPGQLIILSGCLGRRACHAFSLLDTLHPSSDSSPIGQTRTAYQGLERPCQLAGPDPTWLHLEGWAYRAQPTRRRRNPIDMTWHDTAHLEVITAMACSLVLLAPSYTAGPGHGSMRRALPPDPSHLSSSISTVSEPIMWYGLHPACKCFFPCLYPRPPCRVRRSGTVLPGLLGL